MASFGLKVIRGAFGIGERLSPSISGWLAFELFCRTPSERQLTINERKAISAASPFMREARQHRLQTLTDCVVVHEFRPEAAFRGTVLVLHGWRSRTEYMRSIIEGLRDAGFRVVSLDLPGHGGSRGRKLNMARAVDAARMVATWFGPFEAVVGHSFGGALAVNAVTGSIPGIAPVETEKLVLISAPESMPEVFEQYGRIVNVGPRSHRAISRRVQRVAGRPLEDFLGAKQLAGMERPTLVIHAPDDREVSAESAHRYAAAGSHVDLLWVDGAGHRRILGDPRTVDATVAFVSGLSAVASRH